MSNFAENTNPENEKYTLVNAYESVVRTNVRTLIDRDDEICKCEKCFLDVCAIVLNDKRSCYTHFVTTKKGELFIQVPEASLANRAAMAVLILDAINRVKEFPMHDS